MERADCPRDVQEKAKCSATCHQPFEDIRRRCHDLTDVRTQMLVKRLFYPAAATNRRQILYLFSTNPAADADDDDDVPPKAFAPIAFAKFAPPPMKTNSPAKRSFSVRKADGNCFHRRAEATAVDDVPPAAVAAAALDAIEQEEKPLNSSVVVVNSNPS